MTFPIADERIYQPWHDPSTHDVVVLSQDKDQQRVSKVNPRPWHRSLNSSNLVQHSFKTFQVKEKPKAQFDH